MPLQRTDRGFSPWRRAVIAYQAPSGPDKGSWLHRTDKAGPLPARVSPDLSASVVVTAGLPGRVIKVEVRPGQSVKADDVLVVIEAMKMENTVRAPCDAKVESVRAVCGETVTRGAVLVVLARRPDEV